MCKYVAYDSSACCMKNSVGDSFILGFPYLHGSIPAVDDQWTSFVAIWSLVVNMPSWQPGWYW